MTTLALLQDTVFRLVTIMCFAHGYHCDTHTAKALEFEKRAECLRVAESMVIVQGDPEHVAVAAMCPKQRKYPPDATPPAGH